MKLVESFIVFVFILTSTLCVSAQEISGRYDGTADVQPFGKLTIKAEIRQKADKITGSFETPLGKANIVEGSYANGNLTTKAKNPL